MQESYYIASYWFARTEPDAACANRAEAFFRGLAPCDPAFTQWFEQADSIKRARQLGFEPTAQRFQALFALKKYKGVGGGVDFAAWNGREGDDECGASFRCGSLSESVPNICLLSSFHATSPWGDRILISDVLTRILRCMTVAWDPDWGVVTSNELQNLVSPDTDDVALGWLMYFSRRWGSVPLLPEPVRTEPIEDKGTLVILTPERLTASNPAHVELAKEVRERLEQAGLLRRPGH